MEVLNPNRENLEQTARALKSILPELVFVGGALTGVFINDPAATDIRITKDVDVIAKVAGTQGYLWGTQQMRALGFNPDTSEEAPACRWVKEGLMVDLMGTSETPFGPTNPWYKVGFDTCEKYITTDGLEFKILSVPFWMLTKWVAFQDRGGGDILGSRDIEDLVAVLDGRLDGDLDQDLILAPLEVQRGLGEMARALLGIDDFCRLCIAGLGDREERALGFLRLWAGFS